MTGSDFNMNHMSSLQFEKLIHRNCIGHARVQLIDP